MDWSEEYRNAFGVYNYMEIEKLSKMMNQRSPSIVLEIFSVIIFLKTFDLWKL